MLAYSYDYGVEAPAAQVRPLMTAQQQACVAAGPSVCQVTGANLATQDDQVTAKLTFRATPAWLKGYEDKLSDTARQAGGKLSHEEVTSEDLTHQIVDTDAAVKAKTALRDRLQALLETHPGNLADLLAVEQAVANAQADLDATTSNLTVMRERVAMSDVTIEYASGPGLERPDRLADPAGGVDRGRRVRGARHHPEAAAAETGPAEAQLTPFGAVRL